MKIDKLSRNMEENTLKKKKKKTGFFFKNTFCVTQMKSQK